MELKKAEREIPVLGNSFAGCNRAPYCDIAELIVQRKEQSTDDNRIVTFRKEQFPAYIKGIVLHLNAPYLCYSRIINPDNHVQGINIEHLDDIINYGRKNKYDIVHL